MTPQRLGSRPCQNTSTSTTCNNSANISQYACCVQNTDFSSGAAVYPPGSSGPLPCSYNSDCCAAPTNSGEVSMCTPAFNSAVHQTSGFYCVQAFPGGTYVPTGDSCLMCISDQCNTLCCLPDDGATKCTTNSVGGGDCCPDPEYGNTNMLCRPQGVCCQAGNNQCDPNKHPTDCCSGSCVKNLTGNNYHCAPCMGL